MTIADIIFGILIAAPIIVSIITLSELLTFRRLVLKSIVTQNSALSTIMDAQRVTMNTASNIYSIVMEERE